MTRKINIQAALYLSMMALAATAPGAQAFTGVGIGGSTPTQHTKSHVKGVSKTAYIKTADRLCTSMDSEFTPAWEGIKAALNTGSYTTSAGEAIMTSAKATEATFLKLRALPRPVTGRNELIGYFNADSERLTDSYNVGVDENNEEPFALGSNAAKAEIAKVTASEAIASYGFKVCGLS